MMRQGIPMAGNHLMTELAIVTGAVELMEIKWMSFCFFFAFFAFTTTSYRPELAAAMMSAGETEIRL